MLSSIPGITLRILIAILLNIFLILSHSVAQDISDTEEWRSLFNGKDLSGWHLLNGQHEVTVENGMIIGTCISGLPNGFLATEEEFEDFILEIEVNADILLHNSGIQFRSQSIGEYMDGRVHGYQAEVDLTPQKWSGGIYDEARRGWLYILEDEDSPAKGAFRNNQWNTYRIEAIGNTNRIWVNGVPTAHLVDDETDRGFIALQFHGNSRPTTPAGNHKVRFRNIRIKTDNLEPNPYDDIPVVNLIPNDLSGQEEEKGFKMLWDGKTLSGWKDLTDSESSDKRWQMEDGVLTIFSDGESYQNGVLITEEEFDTFELKFDVKQHKENAIIGLEYLGNGYHTEAVFGHLVAKKTKDIGEWNKAIIKAFPDNKVEYWLNGYKIREFYRDSDSNQRFPILLSGQGSTISYRSIKIRELSE